MKKLPYFRFAFVIGLGFAVVTALITFIHRSINLPFSNGGLARIKPASTWESLRPGGTATLFYQPVGLQPGTVTLWQDCFHWPILVMPAADTNVLLCLYEFDVDLRLLRIDPNKRFQPFPTGSDLTEIVSASPWEVRAGGTNDWHLALEYLRTLPTGVFNQQSVPAVNLGIVRFHSHLDLLLERIRTRTRFTN